MSDVERMSCNSVARLLGAHADGQLDAAKTVEVDDHLGNCETCRERVLLQRAIVGSLKKAVKTSTPSDVRARMLGAMAAQAARANVTPIESAKKPSALNWRTMMPLASAAAIALAWGFASKQPLAHAEGMSPRVGAGFSNDELVNQFVDLHSHPMHPETPDPVQVRGFEREVGVPVRVPQLENGRFVGGRLLPVQYGERAAMLQFEVAQQGGGVQRVSVFVFDPRKIQIHSADQLSPRTVGTAQVRVGQARGYSVAVTQHGSVGYAVASDLEDSSAQYAAAAGE